jgi:predicted SprT family Zn-dependent metalloprotease
MDNKLTLLKLSKRVDVYVEEVENAIKETGYTVLMENSQNKGAGVMLDHEHKYICIDINEEEYKKDSQEEIDSTIAHEVTHEFLSLKKKYCRLRCGPKEGKTVGLLSTMIEDIVVNKIIQEKNYRPYSTRYLDTVKREIKSARKGIDFYKEFDYDPMYKDRFIVSRYIQAWEFLEYFNSGEIDKKTIYKFLKVFQKSYPQQYEEAKKIKEIILKNGIFTPDGYRKTIEECLELWDLTNLVEIYTY